MEKVPEDAVQAIEREFEKRKRPLPSILVEEGRGWEKMWASLKSRGYVVRDRMLVMESLQGSRKEAYSGSRVRVDQIGSGLRGHDMQEWTRTYLNAFYGNQRFGDKVNQIMRKVVKDRKASVFLAKVGKASAGCAVMYRTVGGVAGVYCVGTAPAFREKGVAATVLKHIRGVAESEGRKLVLQTMASDDIEGFYVKQGFKFIYAKILLARLPKRARKEVEIPSGEAFGVRINRAAKAGTTMSFAEVFSGFEKIPSVRRLFCEDTDEVISELKIALTSTRGYLRVDGESGNIIINPEYLKTAHERHLYLDAIHELAHVRQFREGKDLYDRRYAYFERPTEIEAYEVAVEEARRIGMDDEEIVDYLRVDWVTEEEFARFVSMMRINRG